MQPYVLPISPTVELDVRLTASWTYIRMHNGEAGTGYSDRELSSWATQIRSFLAQGVEVYVYFNNDPEGHAICDSKRLYALLASKL